MLTENTPIFVHLRSHSEYSVSDSIATVKGLVQAAKQFDQPALAITDLGNVFGLIKFYKNARNQGVKPLAGTEVFLENTEDANNPYKILLLVKDNNGYLQLCDLLTKAWLDNQQRGRAIVKREWLSGNTGLIVLSGALAGDIGSLLMLGKTDLAMQTAKQWDADFPNQYYIELQRSGNKDEESYIKAATNLASSLGIPVVATHPIQFINETDFRAHEARVCIATGEHLANPRRPKNFTNKQYFYSSQQMTELFADIPSAITNAVEIAKRCNLTLDLGTPRLPAFPTPDNISLDDYLVQLSEQGLQQRLEILFPDTAELESRREEYESRLKLECDTIISMGFPGYFLIVADFINWAKNNDVPVGPGRGSGAGSLVAYSLGITDLDPIQYDLLFERFLNPERVSMPDFDIDFCQDNRERVIEYVKQKYGSQAVSQIATFGTMGAKAVLRDVGRVLDMPYGLCDSLAKMIPFSPADPWSLSRALEEEPSFKERYEQDEEVKALVDLALSLEGITRSVGMHAGGVLIAPNKLTDFCPLYCQEDSTSAVSQYDKDDVEEAGLVKFDFLGLRNLTILDWAVRYVREFNSDLKGFDLSTLTLDDENVYKLLGNANTTAVFQLESRGMKELLKGLKPSNFEDIVAVLALFRPGPLESGMVSDFIDRKHGRASVDYFHDDLEPVLKSTYGVIVYQEQVMLISQIIGGYSLGSADILRRAMGKKDPEEMAAQRELFEKGAIDKGHNPKLAVKLFDLMEKFAGYGFNKSHSAAYALISYQTAWLKAHHPAEFLAATLSSDLDDTDRIQLLNRDCVENNVMVLPPDVNQSNYRFEPVEDANTRKGKPPMTIRYGLGAIKGAGQAAIESIIKARNQDGPFTSLFDFCRRIDRGSVNKRTIEGLIKSGAFDSIESNRAALLATVSQALEAAEQAHNSVNQISLFDDTTDEFVDGQLSKTIPWDKHTLLIQEKSALGFFFSDHLFNAWESEIKQLVNKRLVELKPSNSPQWFAGILGSTRTTKTRRGRMLYAALDDGTAQLEVAVFNELYESKRNILKEDNLIIIHGKVVHDDYSGGLRVTADSIYDLQQAREQRATSIKISFDNDYNADALRKILNPHRAQPENGINGVQVIIDIIKPKFKCKVELGKDWWVRLDNSMIKSIQDWLGNEKVEIMYPGSENSSNIYH